jgi:glucose/arabinose dehydrogenase
MRRICLHVGLAWLLLFAQQAAFAHLISHAAQQNTQQSPAHDNDHNSAHNTAKACAKCLVAAQLGSAVGGAMPAAPVYLATLPAPTARLIATRSVILHAYRSRAPPSFL